MSEFDEFEEVANATRAEWYADQDAAKLQDEIESLRTEVRLLKEAIVHADEWLGVGEGVDLTYYMCGDDDSRRLIDSIIKPVSGTQK